jgi:hypothetical protein
MFDPVRDADDLKFVTPDHAQGMSRPAFHTSDVTEKQSNVGRVGLQPQ